VYFQPKAKVELAVAQITALSQSLLRPLPPGTTAPSIIKYDASSVPIIQLGMQSDTLSEQELFDMGQNFIRTQLATIQGASVPLPYGGKFRQVMVDLNPGPALCEGLSAADVSAMLGNQNLIFPAGTVKIGDRDYQVKLNSSPRILAEMNDLPLKVVNGATVYLKTWRRCATAIACRPALCAPMEPAGRVDGAAQRQGVHAGGSEQREGRVAEDSGGPVARTQGTNCSINRCSCVPRSTAWCARE
jgi:Cu/Ag efflux pump CusA